MWPSESFRFWHFATAGRRRHCTSHGMSLTEATYICLMYGNKIKLCFIISLLGRVVSLLFKNVKLPECHPFVSLTELGHSLCPSSCNQGVFNIRGSSQRLHTHWWSDWTLHVYQHLQPEKVVRGTACTLRFHVRLSPFFQKWELDYYVIEPEFTWNLVIIT